MAIVGTSSVSFAACRRQSGASSTPPMPAAFLPMDREQPHSRKAHVAQGCDVLKGGADADSSATELAALLQQLSALKAGGGVDSTVAEVQSGAAAAASSNRVAAERVLTQQLPVQPKAVASHECWQQQQVQPQAQQQQQQWRQQRPEQQQEQQQWRQQQEHRKGEAQRNEFQSLMDTQQQTCEAPAWALCTATAVASASSGNSNGPTDIAELIAALRKVKRDSREGSAELDAAGLAVTGNVPGFNNRATQLAPTNTTDTAAGPDSIVADPIDRLLAALRRATGDRQDGSHSGDGIGGSGGSGGGGDGGSNVPENQTASRDAGHDASWGSAGPSRRCTGQTAAGWVPANAQAFVRHEGGSAGLVQSSSNLEDLMAALRAVTAADKGAQAPNHHAYGPPPDQVDLPALQAAAAAGSRVASAGRPDSTAEDGLAASSMQQPQASTPLRPYNAAEPEQQQVQGKQHHRCQLSDQEHTAWVHTTMLPQSPVAGRALVAAKETRACSTKCRNPDGGGVLAAAAAAAAEPTAAATPGTANSAIAAAGPASAAAGPVAGIVALLDPQLPSELRTQLAAALLAGGGQVATGVRTVNGYLQLEFQAAVYAGCFGSRQQHVGT